MEEEEDTRTKGRKKGGCQWEKGLEDEMDGKEWSDENTKVHKFK